MMTDTAIVKYKNIASSTAQNVIDAIRDCVDGSGHWLIDDAITQTSEQIAIKPHPQYFGDADDQRIVFRANSTRVEVGYAPLNGLGTDLSAIPAGVNWTGWRSITATTAAAGIGALITRVYVVEYRDDPSSGANPASSIAVLLSTGSAFSWAAMAGRIIAMDNESDELNGYRGDGLMTGVPRDLEDAGSWIFGTTSTTSSANLHSSILRGGETHWGYLRPTEIYSAAKVADIAGRRILVPFSVYGLGQALPTANSARNYGVLGQLKYYRNARESLPFGGTWSSGEQVWTAVTYDVNANDACLLWSKNVTEVL
jgi:hypothetical protein